MSSQEFDFDHWRDLAERDPEAFFEARRCLIEEFITSAPPTMESGLREFQNVIDGVRVEAATPMKAVRRIVGMMGEHLDALYSNMERLKEESSALMISLDPYRE